MKLFLIIDGTPTEAELEAVLAVKEFAEIDKSLIVHTELIGGRPTTHS